MANWLDTPGKNVPGNVGVEPAAMRPLGQQQIVGLSTATSLTVPVGALIALIQAESKDIRWIDDGSSPTASTGMKLIVGSPYSYAGDLNAIKLIETAATATLNVSYYG